MDIEQTTQDVAAAEREHEAALTLRKKLRWKSKPGTQRRERDIGRRISAIDCAMKPLRSHIGKLVWEPIPDELEGRLRAASRALQADRKQLKKMRRSG